MKKKILFLGTYITTSLCPAVAATEDLLNVTPAAVPSTKPQAVVRAPLLAVAAAAQDNFDVDAFSGQCEKDRRAFEIAMLKAETDFQFIMGERHRMVKKFQDAALSADDE